MQWSFNPSTLHSMQYSFYTTRPIAKQKNKNNAKYSSSSTLRNTSINTVVVISNTG